MAYQTITANNMDLQCGIQIQCKSNGTAVGNVDSVVLKRRYTGTTAWTTIATVSITNIEDFTFTHFDADVRSGYSYDYLAVPVINNMEQAGVGTSCTCIFDATYIADSTGAWVSLYNNEYSMQKNTQVSYITPLAGKYPRRVSNASTNYMTGSITGLFLPFNTVGFPIKEKAREYKDSLLEMLSNGKPKLLKTYDGNAWIISVDATPKENFSPFTGASTTTFNWTEIGELDKPPATLSDYDSAKFWLNDGYVFMDGMKNSSGVDFTFNSDGTVTFRTVKQSVTTFSLDKDNDTILYEYIPDANAPVFTVNSNGIMVVTI